MTIPSSFVVRRQESTLPVCEQENVTFSNLMMTSNVHVGIEQISRNCELSVNLSNCTEPTNEVEGHVISDGETDVTIQIDHIEMFYGSNVVAELNDACDDCREIFYIPNIMPTGYHLNIMFLSAKQKISFYRVQVCY